MKFIAEIGSNHNQDLERCLKLIDAAAEVGVDGVKFQFFRAESLYAKEILQNETTRKTLKSRELPVEYIPYIRDRCRDYGLILGITPFAVEDVKIIAPCVDFIKIASYELLWDQLLITAARTRLPIVLSTGMADIEEVSSAVVQLKYHAGCTPDITLLHCVSGYPAHAHEANLKAIQTLRDIFKFPVGWSDHTVSPDVIYRAVHRWDADMVEFHFDLEGKGAEAGNGHCWYPHKIAPVIRSIKNSLECDGDGVKSPSESEIKERDWRTDPVDGLRPRIYARKGAV